MRRKLVYPLSIGRFISSWDDGTEGYEWKSRALAEKRSLALNFLGDVNKRVQIHDAIRLKADINKHAIQNTSIPEFFQGNDDKENDVFDKIDYNSILSMIEGEIDSDTLAHINSSDASLLKNEFLNLDDSTETKFLRKWINLRRDIADYQSYAAIPEGERNSWSAWYLRNVRANKNSEE